MNSRIFQTVLLITIGVPLALLLGVSAAQNQVQTVLWMGAVVFGIVCLLLGRHIWILIPATLGMSGSLNFLPGAPAPWHLMTAVVGCVFLLRWATRQQKLHFRWSGMETALILVALTIFQAFARNPTGVALFGGDVAGGKPYIIFTISFAAFFLVSQADADIRTWRWAVIAYLTFALADALISTASSLFPSVARIVINYYSNVSFAAAHELGYVGDIQNTRISGFTNIGSILGMIACCFWRPLAALDFTKPWRGLTALASVILLLLGGGRSGSFRLFVNFITSSLLRRKPADVFAVGILGFLLLAAVLIAVPTTSLPYSVQRVFSVIPGVTVSSDVRQDAKGSKEIRFEMWKLVLTTDRYIHNKLLGDGFQINASELAARQAMMFGDTRMSGGMTQQDQLLAMGSYHGFHAETIRFTGVIGLLAATAALIVFAVFANRNIRSYRDHPYWGYVLFICMPYLIHPLWVWLVFGSYRSGFPELIAMAGMIRLLTNIRYLELHPIPHAQEKSVYPQKTATGG